MNEQDFKFQSQRGKCPCGEGKRCFAKVEGYPATVGKCFACGKFFPPKSSSDSRAINSGLVHPPKPKPPLQFISEDVAVTTLKRIVHGFTEYPFHAWLQKRVTSQHYMDLCFTWLVGGTREAGGTLFWYEDEAGRIRNCKRVWYQKDGHRDKNRLPSFMYKREAGYGQCLYGAFQLKGDYRSPFTWEPFYSDSTVVLVESEKTCLVSAVLRPQFLWLATGGADGLTKEKASILHGRTVIVWYDADEAGRAGAERARTLLSELGCDVHVHNPYPELTDGTDAADMIDREASQESANPLSIQLFA